MAKKVRPRSKRVKLVTAIKFRRAKRKGRQVGATEVLGNNVKEAIVNAAIRLGRDGKGKDGLEGYLMWLARREPKSFAPLLGKVIPYFIDARHSHEHKLEKLTHDQAVELLRAKGLPVGRIFELPPPPMPKVIEAIAEDIEEAELVEGEED